MSASDIMDAVVRMIYAIEQLTVRHVINGAISADGTWHYFIGQYLSAALRESLGISKDSPPPTNT